MCPCLRAPKKYKHKRLKMQISIQVYLLAQKAIKTVFLIKKGRKTPVLLSQRNLNHQSNIILTSGQTYNTKITINYGLKLNYSR